MSFLPTNDPIYAAIRNTAAKFGAKKELKMPELPAHTTTKQKASSANAQSAAKKPLPPHTATKQKAKAAPKAAPAPKSAAEAGKESSRAKRAAYQETKLFSPTDIAQAMGWTPKAVRQKLRRIEHLIPSSLLISTKEVRWGFSEVEAVVTLLKAHTNGAGI